ncbi:nuclease-related domain-containing protein [Tessaracoccus terricola]
MKLRYAGNCRRCGTEIAARVEAIYERDTKTVRCLDCDDAPTETPPSPAPMEPASSEPIAPDPVPQTPVGSAVTHPTEPDKAGASARREYERRRAKDEAALREKWGRFGGIAVALADEKQSTKAWATGAVGEERLGRMFDAMANENVKILHDRRIPRTRANIDHVVVTGSRVWVVDAKRYKGRPDLRIEGGILRPRTEKLTVGGRDCSKLIDGVLKQAALVQEVVGDVPVTPVLCFVEADWPLIGGSFQTRGVQVVWPKKLRKMIMESSAGPHAVLDLHAAIGSTFPQS